MSIITVQNATIYLESMLGINKIECRQVSWEIRQYAQYPSAIKLMFIEKGKRKEGGVWLSYKAYGLVVEGFNHVAPGSVWNKAETSASGTVSRTAKYSCCSDGYSKDFDALFEQYQAANPQVKVLADFRGFNTYEIRADNVA